MQRDPALDVDIQPPRAYYRRKVGIALPLLVWVAIAIPFLWRYAPDDDPPLAGLLGLVCSGVALILVALPIVWRSLRETRVGLRAKADNQRAIEALQRFDVDAAEQIWRTSLAAPDATPLVRFVLVHNLGIAAFERGDFDAAQVLLDRSLDCGWQDAARFAGMRPMLFQGHAMVALCRGDAARARQLLTQAGSGRGDVRHALELTRVLLFLREDRPGDALRIGRALPFARLRGYQPQTARLFTAWAAERAGEPEDVVSELCGDATLPTGKPGWLCAWPGFVAWLTARGRLT
ncbi:MAG: hypothetical protein H6742_14985 [Alphaproteobacteria bacterium]|nr:hypothetical protein [Alphaproteobacteria bacterium]